MKVYLCGPINGCTDDECKDWRQYSIVRLALHGIECFDPMVRDYRGVESGAEKLIVEQDKLDIDSSDVVLVYYFKPSVGTSMEVLYAWERNKKVVLVNLSNAQLSPWLIYHSHAQFLTLPEALDYIAQGAGL